MLNTMIILGVVLALAVVGYFVAPKGWRTVVINALVGLPMLAGQLLTLLAGFDFGAVMSPTAATWALLAVNAINIVMRNLTTTPLGEDA